MSNMESLVTRFAARPCRLIKKKDLAYLFALRPAYRLRDDMQKTDIRLRHRAPAYRHCSQCPLPGRIPMSPHGAIGTCEVGALPPRDLLTHS